MPTRDGADRQSPAPLDRVWPLLRRALFRLDAERAHDLTLRTVARAPRLVSRLVHVGRPPAPRHPRTLAGLSLPNPIGLAAGLDKDGLAIPFWPRIGFGFIEVGTVTA